MTTLKYTLISAGGYLSKPTIKKVKITTKEVKQMMEDEGLEEEDALAEILNGYMAEMGQLFTQTIILSESEVEYIKLKLK